jgi:hypothetical protein
MEQLTQLNTRKRNFLIIISFHFWKDQTIPNPTQ